MADRMWYYMRDNEQVGPVSPEELLRLLATGTLAADVYVWAEGMSEWRPASEIVELGGHLPPVSSAEELMPPSIIRPKPVTVFGILNIIFGILGLLCTPLAIAVTFLPNQPEGLQLGPAMKAYGIVGHIIGFAVSILLLAAGIGLLHLKRWARKASYGYGWFALVWALVGLAVNVIVYSSMLPKASPETMPAVVGGLVGGMCGGIVGLVYPIFLIVYMKRPLVVEACQR